MRSRPAIPPVSWVFVVYKHICDTAPNLQLRQHLFVHLKGKFLIPYHVGINNAAPQNCVVQLDRHFRGGLRGCLLRTSPPDYSAFAFHPESSTVSFSSHTLVGQMATKAYFSQKIMHLYCNLLKTKLNDIYYVAN